MRSFVPCVRPQLCQRTWELEQSLEVTGRKGPRQGPQIGRKLPGTTELQVVRLQRPHFIKKRLSTTAENHLPPDRLVSRCVFEVCSQKKGFFLHLRRETASNGFPHPRCLTCFVSPGKSPGLRDRGGAKEAVTVELDMNGFTGPFGRSRCDAKK